jgi:OOP family OmpA-OmpF porin
VLRAVTLVLFSITALACATPKASAPIEAAALALEANEAIAVDQLVVLVDTSSSVSKTTLFQDQKALVESFARSMPDGQYETSTIAFGGFKRETSAPAPFQRDRVVRETEEISHLSEGTPIHRVIAEAGQLLEGKSGRAALLLYTDGLITDEIGRDVESQLALDALAAVEESYDGTVCLHSVQVGDDPDGAAFLRRLADATSCGSYRRQESVASVAALYDFERDVLVGPAPPAVAAAPRDLDQDGILDMSDLCPNTPRGVEVDSRGCWALTALFDTDSATLKAEATAELDRVAERLGTIPDVRIRLDGHTDSTGPDAYNLSLSKRRADAVRSYLVNAGVDAARLESEGFGETKPAADNSTAEGRQINRRTEVTAILP